MNRDFVVHGTTTGRNYPGFDNTAPADCDAFEHADHCGLLRDHEPDVTDIFERAGMSGETHTDAAMRNDCMYEAGFQMLGASDDSYYEV